jgi:hypothetical protein
VFRQTRFSADTSTRRYRNTDLRKHRTIRRLVGTPPKVDWPSRSNPSGSVGCVYQTSVNWLPKVVTRHGEAESGETRQFHDL